MAIIIKKKNMRVFKVMLCTV